MIVMIGRLAGWIGATSFFPSLFQWRYSYLQKNWAGHYAVLPHIPAEYRMYLLATDIKILSTTFM